MTRTPRRLSILLAVTTALLAALLGCRSEGDSWPRIEESGLLRVGLDPTYPPFELADGESLTGLDIDLARALAADLGLQAEFTYIGYDGLYDALATGRVDVLISALVVAPEKTRDFAFSDSYFNAGEVLVLPQADLAIAGMADMDGRTLAVELGAQGHVVATTWQQRLGQLNILPYNTAEAAIAAVAAGEADAALLDGISARLQLLDQSQLMRLPQPVTVEPYAMVVRIADRKLLKNLNESLARLHAAGRMEEMISRWLGP